jgi:hypothetical protein
LDRERKVTALFGRRGGAALKRQVCAKRRPKPTLQFQLLGKDHASDDESIISMIFVVITIEGREARIDPRINIGPFDGRARWQRD